MNNIENTSHLFSVQGLWGRTALQVPTREGKGDREASVHLTDMEVLRGVDSMGTGSTKVSREKVCMCMCVRVCVPVFASGCSCGSVCACACVCL
jgi:hypothetical protein